MRVKSWARALSASDRLARGTRPFRRSVGIHAFLYDHDHGDQRIRESTTNLASGHEIAEPQPDVLLEYSYRLVSLAVVDMHIQADEVGDDLQKSDPVPPRVCRQRDGLVMQRIA